MLSRKGNVDTGLESVFYVLAFLMAGALVIFILYYAFNQAKEPLDTALSSAIPAGETSVNVTLISSQALDGVGLFNALFPFLLLGLIIMTMVSAFFVNSHPVFFFISLIILAVVIVLGVVFSNAYQQITESTEFGDTKDNFNVMNLFMKYLPFIGAIVVIIVMIVLFAKPGGSGGGGL